MDVLQVCVMEEPELERGVRRESLLDDGCSTSLCYGRTQIGEGGEARKLAG